MNSVVDCIWQHAASSPERRALVVGEIDLSYRQLVCAASSAADVMRSHGVGKGDRVLLAAVHQLEYISAYLGAQMIGAVTVPLDPNLPVPRFREIESIVSPKQTYWRDDRYETRMLSDFGRFVESFPAKPCVDVDLPCEILFTSGTTGTPKGVVLTHRNQLASARNINSVIGNTCTDLEVIALPLYHSFGAGRMRCVFIAGGVAVLVNGYASPKRFFKALSTWKATGTSLVPAAWAHLQKLTGDYIGRFADQLRYIEIGSAAMPRRDKEALAHLMPKTKIMMHYGLTEASRSVFLSFHVQPIESLGRPTPNVEIRILDRDGRAVETGTDGEICVSGDHVFASYLDDPIRSQASFFGRFFKTGDLGHYDGDGTLWLTGRRDDMINVGGRKVAPDEVERVLRRLRGVADCACVAAPDELNGETVAAFLVAERQPLTKSVIDEFLKNHLEVYKHPTIVHWIEEIPRNPSGKTSRYKLRTLVDV